VFGERPGDCWRAGRTQRSLRLRGVLTLERLPPCGPVLLLRAGSWLLRREVRAPPPSATGRPLLALGAVRARGEATPDAEAWTREYARARGEFDAALLPPLVSVFLDDTLTRAVGEEMQGDLGHALRAAALRTSARVVHFPALDVWDHDGLRVAEVVTSLHQGGGERIAVELTRGLRARGVATRLFALGAPQRAALQAPRGTLQIRAGAGLRRALVGFGSDVVHVHLARRGVVLGLRRAGLPVAVTLHNTRESWPPGTRRLEPGEAALIACSRAVERAIRRARLPRPQRTVWNGIAVGAYASTPEREEAARRWRDRLGFSSTDFVLLSVANPRPQKRLERLPSIVEATREAFRTRGISRRVRLVLAGAPGRDPRSHEALAAFVAEVARLELGDDVRHVGSVADLAPLYLAADALVSPSAHEGLSLAQLEALAAGRPAIATAVGGAPEVASSTGALKLVPKDAPPSAFAEALLSVARCAPESGRAAVQRSFSSERMAEGYARILHGVARAAARKRAEGVLLVTNNFSTGGAQSSARRLLLGLRQAGIAARAALLQEQPAYPTPGRRALEAAGIPVLALQPPEECDPAEAVERLLEAVDDAPPAAVLFWNALTQHKLLLADALLDIPIYDVSPGEMYFESLERYFERPRPGLPYTRLRDYGARLAGVVVKYRAEAERASALGAPVHVIPNGVPLPDPRAARSGNGHVVFGTLARLDPRKRVDMLLLALRLASKRLPPHELRIAGGPERSQPAHLDELKHLARGLPVAFVGEQPEPQRFLRELDVFALVAEPAGCPNASLEAMAAGLPVVATRAGGMAEQIEDGLNGRLVGREDVSGLADALVQTGGDATLRRSMGDAARARVAEQFGMPKMIDAYVRLCLG